MNGTAQLHPRHPGLGSPTSLVEAESADGDPEVGGFVIFFPSGHHMTVGWRSVRPIEPAIDAAKKYAADIIDKLIRANSDEAQADMNRTNWVSVVAAIQKIVLDWNFTIRMRISSEMARRFGGPLRVH